MQRTFDELTTWPSQNGASEEAAEHQLAQLVEKLQDLTGGPHGYRLRRIILTNFWLYGLQEFEIPHGRLFLAGENASGKSTVLMAALPLALDGDLRPNRLDTFGGRERHIDYYVLGGTESATPFNHERRTSYIALEFEWCDPDSPPIAEELRQRWENGEREKTRFLTIGISLAGNINASDRIRPLRFLITDGSRLGYDLHTTYETGSKHDKRAYDHAHFKQQLEGHGIICDTQAEYERQVARYLFGFNDLKDYQKLINLLLVLRRPNLSTELSFSKVHDYLKQSLRKISGETTSHVIGTIERIDAIQGEIERVQEAYNAAEHLHLAQQQLVLKRAQLATCEYMGAQLAEDSIQHRVTRLRRELFAADNERQQAETRAQTLQAEQHQVTGQIKALEASEGLQVAQRLTAARERAQETLGQTQLQQQSLEAARKGEQSSAEYLVRQQRRFEKMKADGISHLRTLSASAREECYWETAALQLESSLQQLGSLSTQSLTAPAIPPAITALTGVQSEERIAWLHDLENLHRQREKLETNLHHTRSLETTRFQELDESRRRFQSVQDHFYDAQQQVAQELTHYTSNELEMEDMEVDLPSTADDAPFPSEDESSPVNLVELCAATLNGYRQTIDMLEQQFDSKARQVQETLNELQQRIGVKRREIEEIEQLVEQKRAEPEFTPTHPERRTIARTRLAEHNITAIPLYALLDFAPGLDSESEQAGRIEQFLEDAGLLDALVVAPSQITIANSLLAAGKLNDCLLNMEAINQIAANMQYGQGDALSLQRLLRFDETVSATLNGNETAWQTLVSDILTAIRYDATSPDTLPTERAISTLNNDGTWTHGLLSGHTGGGVARAIGKTTRLRQRQRELERLQEQQGQLEEELRVLTDQRVQHERQLQQLQESQAQLRKVLKNSGIEEIYSALAQAKLALDETQSKYHKARLQTQEVRQHCNVVLAQLERESNGIGPLASSIKQTQEALLATTRLQNQVQALHTHLASVIHAWEECQQASETHEQAQSAKANAANLYERMHVQVLQAQAEEAELQRIAAASNVEALGERLHTLREQSETLAAQLEKARTDHARADERVSNMQNNLSEAEANLQQATDERVEKQQRFVDLLTAYPVEALLEVQQLIAVAHYREAAQRILNSPLKAEDIALQKERLEEAYRSAYNNLLKTFSQEQAVLLEYGPNLDEQGYVLFLNENKCRPIELLDLLSDHITMQKTLLGQEERLLFEDFLLQEMAEAIRTAIFEAEEWVQQINNVLSNLPLIGEHYALQWKSLGEYDLTRPGSHLAQHYKLLRKPAQALTSEETETLMSAFRQEIAVVRLHQQESADINFMDALEQVFDYREWFHFDVLVTPIGGQRQRLTDRMAGTRSGAEQLFALYVPLFAALGALYRSAVPGAPRLLALDEAFDKVSAANTQRILEFLVSQDFQWIMTGPQVSGTGAKIPACARYLMIHEKGSPVATASASFWSDSKK